MGYCFQNNSWFQLFDDDFLWKVSLKKLNLQRYYYFRFTFRLTDLLNFILLIFCHRYTACFKIGNLIQDFWKVWNFNHAIFFNSLLLVCAVMLKSITVIHVVICMVKYSKFLNSWTLKNQNFKLAVCLQNIINAKLNGQIPLDKLKLNQKKLSLSAEFSILRLTFYGKSASKSWIQE